MISNLAKCSHLCKVSRVSNKISICNVKQNQNKFVTENLRTTRVTPFLPKVGYQTRPITEQAISERHWVVNPVNKKLDFHATTVLTLRKNNKIVMMADGQVTLGSTVVKGTANKIRKLGDGQILAGFAGSTADAFSLFEKLESKIEQYPGQLLRACVEMAKNWRTDKYLRRLEAVMIVADKDISLLLTGNGDVQDYPDGLIAIGSGGPYAYCSAKALVENAPDMDIEKIARKSMEIASDICIYTNKNFVTEVLEYDPNTIKTV